MREDGGFEFEWERRAGGDGDAGIGRDGVALVPGFPEGGDGGNGDGRERFRGAQEEFGQGRGKEDERDAVEEEGENEVRETVGVGEGNAGEVRRGGRELHGGDDVRGVGGKLRAGEGDAFGGGGAAGGELEMGDMLRRRGKLGRSLRGFERAGHDARTPSAQNIEEELGTAAAGKQDGGGR